MMPPRQNQRMTRIAIVNCFFIDAVLLNGQMLVAQQSPGKVFGYEASVSWMDLAPTGDVQTNSNRVNLDSDLGIDGMQSQFSFWFLAKPWHRSGLFAEF